MHKQSIAQVNLCRVGYLSKAACSCLGSPQTYRRTNSVESPQAAANCRSKFRSNSLKDFSKRTKVTDFGFLPGIATCRGTCASFTWASKKR